MKSAEKIETFLREAFPGQTIAVGDLSPTLRMRLRHVAVLIGRLEEERGLTLMPFPSDKGRWVTGRVFSITKPLRGIMTTMTFDEFKAIIIAKVGEDKVIFHEFGKYGYTTIDDILDKKPGGRPGVHECQARSINRNRQLLFGHYNFNTQEAKFWD